MFCIPTKFKLFQDFATNIVKKTAQTHLTKLHQKQCEDAIGYDVCHTSYPMQKEEQAIVDLFPVP